MKKGENMNQNYTNTGVNNPSYIPNQSTRSEERRVGKECRL